VKPYVCPACSLPQLQFYPPNDRSVCFKDADSTRLYPRKKKSYNFHRGKYSDTTCKISYILHKTRTKILQQLPVEQQNKKSNNTNNDTFIDRKSRSLASSRRQPPAEQSSITIILKITFSCLLLILILILSSKKYSRGISF
jgi:hypothetical protein